MFNQLKEIWGVLTPWQKKILSIYFVIGLPWIPMSLFAILISKSEGTKSWPDTVEARKQDVIMILSMSVAMTVFGGLLLLLFWLSK